METRHFSPVQWVSSSSESYIENPRTRLKAEKASVWPTLQDVWKVGFYLCSEHSVNERIGLGKGTQPRLLRAEPFCCD